MAELVPVLVALVVGALLLAALVIVVLRPVRRFTRARAELRDEVRTGVAQLRALAYERGNRHTHGVDSP
ncbi:hypothetical protein [Pseudonocardia humida]|uniref:Uncharacterized protein n=1 Tax=Pseudonocardia humida TaxID=2800819 RepID=A0ABT0ZZB8_9PSEU|nr:hypothetical protein [Pseudonocardia humida]MCO1656080.1 hypothetical protein [Pseudonocardia humida]